MYNVISDAWEDLMLLCSQTMEVCHGRTNVDDPHYHLGYSTPCCLKEPVYVVRWSDRVSYCCEDHLACIKGYAARDSESDRTDDPFIDTFNNNPIVSKYWDKLVERAELL